MTCSDYFTKWPEACAVPDKSAISVADFLFKLITIHGSPAIVQSDQGREFINEVQCTITWEFISLLIMLIYFFCMSIGQCSLVPTNWCGAQNICSIPPSDKRFR